MESKTLNTIQIFMRVGRIFSGITYVSCLVCGILCFVGLATVGTPRGLVIGGVSIYPLIACLDNLDLGSFYATVITGGLVCIATCILAKLFMHYFDNELAAGTPFTIEGSRELLRLGICAICIPLATVAIAQVSCVSIGLFYPGASVFDIDGGGAVLVGVTLIILSLVCKHGAEQAGEPLA